MQFLLKISLQKQNSVLVNVLFNWNFSWNLTFSGSTSHYSELLRLSEKQDRVTVLTVGKIQICMKILFFCDNRNIVCVLWFFLFEKLLELHVYSKRYCWRFYRENFAGLACQIQIQRLAPLIFHTHLICVL